MGLSFSCALLCASYLEFVAVHGVLGTPWLLVRKDHAWISTEDTRPPKEVEEDGTEDGGGTEEMEEGAVSGGDSICPSSSSEKEL